MLSEDEKEFLFILGFCYIQQRKYQRAEIIFRALQILQPHSKLALKCLAYVLYAQGNVTQADQLLRRLVNNPDDKRDVVWANFMRLMLQAKNPQVRQPDQATSQTSGRE